MSNTITQRNTTETDIERSIAPLDRDDDKFDTTHTEDVKHIPEHGRVNDQDAAGYVNPDLEITPEENKRMKRRINRRVLPIMCLVYMTQALDKGALGPVSIMGWLEDVNAQGQDFSWTSTIMWIGIICGEPIANQLVRRFPVAKIMAISMMVWTILVFALAFSMTVPPILAGRFLIGFFEATFGPCLLTITVMWYKREEQPFVQAIWQSMSAAATTVASLYGYGFYHIKYPNSTNLRGWQWLILTLGCGSLIATVLTWFYLPDSPTRVKWASEEEKTRLVERVRGNDQGIKQKAWKKEQAWEAFTDPYTYCLFSLALFQTLVVGGLGKFNSLLINRAFGFDVLTSQLIKIPLSFIGVSFYLIMAWIITKWNQTIYAMIGFTILNVVGNVVLIVVPPSGSTRVGLFIAFMLMQAFAAVNPAIFLMLSRNSAGSSKKSLTYAVTYMGWASGNAIAPQLFYNEWAPRYIPSLYIHMGLYGAFILICLGTRLLLSRRNAKKEAGISSGHSHAFEDLTDIQNPDFRYSL